MDDKAVVIITGASRGVGASVARWLGKTGARLVIAARSKDGLLKRADEVEKLGGKALAVSMDVSDPDACRSLISKTLDTFGRIDGVVNNAGVVTPLASLENADPAELIQYRSPVGFGPSLNRCPRCESPFLLLTSVRVIK